MSKDTQTYTNYITTVNAEECVVHTDADLNPGDCIPVNSSVTIRIMAINAQADDTNDASIVTKMTDGIVDLHFEGDASSSVEAQMVS
jgi:competence protein ComEC